MSLLKQLKKSGRTIRNHAIVANVPLKFKLMCKWDNLKLWYRERFGPDEITLSSSSHIHKRIIIGNKILFIDILLSKIIHTLNWNLGIKTVFSCQGGKTPDGINQGCGHMSFDSHKDLVKFLRHVPPLPGWETGKYTTPGYYGSKPVHNYSYWAYFPHKDIQYIENCLQKTVNMLQSIQSSSLDILHQMEEGNLLYYAGYFGFNQFIMLSYGNKSIKYTLSQILPLIEDNAIVCTTISNKEFLLKIKEGSLGKRDYSFNIKGYNIDEKP